MNSSRPASSGIVYRFFFAPGAPEEKTLSLVHQYLLIFLLYAVTRLATSWVCYERGFDYLVNDPGNYVATAEYVSVHHHLPTEDNPSYRQFAGLSLLMAVFNPLFGNMVFTGYVITTVSSLVAVFLFHHLFRDFRMSLMFCIFLPWWIVANYTVSSEGPTIACFIIGLWVLRDHAENLPVLLAGLLAAGFSIVIRQPAMFSVLPLVFIYTWLRPGGNLFKAALLSAVVCLPMVVYLTWNWLTIHELFPQYRLQQETARVFLSQLHHPEWYGASPVNWPFHSFLAGIRDPDERFWKKVSVAFCVVVVLVAIVALARDTLKEREPARRALMLAMTFALAGHFFFYISVGNINGFRWLDRYLSHINPLIDYALFYHRPLRWPWIAALTAGGTLFAMSCGQGHGSWLFFK